MKILFVINCLKVGGAQRVVVDLADSLSELGDEIIIAHLHNTVGIIPGNQTVGLENIGLSSIIEFMPAYFKLRSLINRFKPDVVHSHLIPANILTGLIRMTTPMRRLITSAHNADEEGKLRMVAYRLTNWLDMFTNFSVEAVAAFVAQKVVKKGRMLVVHNGINTEHFSLDRFDRKVVRNDLGLDDDMQVVLAVGRIQKQKDYPNLLNGLSTIMTHDQRIHLLI